MKLLKALKILTALTLKWTKTAGNKPFWYELAFYAIKFLRSVLAAGSDPGVDKRTVTEAQRSLDMIMQKKATGNFNNPSPFCSCNKKKRLAEKTGDSNAIENSPYIDVKDRKQVMNKNILGTDHDGVKKEFTKLIDRPALLTFFYTRCQNDSKCSATIAQLASLQDHLSSLSLNNKVRLVAITFEPQHDSPDLLKRYMTDRGVKLGSDAMAIKLDTGGHQALINELMIPVGFNSGWVNGHGVEAILLDKNKRIVRKYNSSFWNTPELLADLTRLLKEENQQ